MPELAYVNGVFCPVGEATVSIEDRGFQFGDGVYEVVVVYGGRPFLLDRHLLRLERSLAAIGLVLDLAADPLEPIIAEGLKRSGLAEALIYIQITRGVAPRNHTIPKGMPPTIVMTFKPRPEVPAELRQRGASLVTTVDTRWANCSVKAITLLPNVIAKNDALGRGYDDAIFVTASGEVRECTAANLFVVHDQLIRIPPRTESILHGVTQGFVVECAATVGLEVVEEAFDVQTLSSADEAFMSGTTIEVLGITRIDDQPVGGGEVGRITQRLQAEFRARVRPGKQSYSGTFNASANQS